MILAVFHSRGLISPSSPSMVTVSSPLRLSEAQVVPSSKTKGTTPIPTRFERWIRSKDCAMTALTPRRLVPLAAQSRDEPLPYSTPAKMTSGTPSSLYFIAAS
ncbi:hypothetical protein D3C71_1784110 [compost metagenome]